MSAKVTDDTFQQEVLQSDIPVLVDFYSDECGPCNAAAPSIDAIAEEYAGRVKVAKADVADNTVSAKEQGVRGIPNFVVFKGGLRVEQLVGWSESRPDDIRAALEAALA